MQGQIINKKDLPKSISLSQHLLSRCTEVIEIDLFGREYYIPITEDIDRIIKRGTFGNINLIRNADLFQDIINSVYLQIRDTVGSEIHSQLSQQIEEGFAKLFHLPLAKEINKQLNMALPPKREEDGKQQ